MTVFTEETEASIAAIKIIDQIVVHSFKSFRTRHTCDSLATIRVKDVYL